MWPTEGLTRRNVDVPKQSKKRIRSEIDRFAINMYEILADRTTKLDERVLRPFHPLSLQSRNEEIVGIVVAIGRRDGNLLIIG